MAKKSGASQEVIVGGANTLLLIIDNDEKTYTQKVYMFKNLTKKVEKGTFDPIKAEKIFKPLTDRVRIDYNKEDYDREQFIPIESSRLADINLVHRFIRAHENKEYDFM